MFIFKLIAGTTVQSDNVLLLSIITNCDNVDFSSNESENNIFFD